jgi:hypothetical protein
LGLALAAAGAGGAYYEFRFETDGSALAGQTGDFLGKELGGHYPEFA